MSDRTDLSEFCPFDADLTVEHSCGSSTLSDSLPSEQTTGQGSHMVQKQFAGDPQYRLPKGKVEPYRLWFEFLKVALRHPDIQVDQDLYKNWNVEPDTDFDDWWGGHWRELFATKAETAVIETVEDFKAAVDDPRFAVLRVALPGTKKRRLKDIEDALAGRTIPTGRGRSSSTTPAFTISSKRSMNLKTLRGMLKYLQFYADKRWDLEDASLAYSKWSREWNDKVRAKKWKRPLVYVPPFLGKFAETVDERQKSKYSGPKKRNNPDGYDDLRGQARRFIRRGEKILKNVAVGRFPGSF